MIKLIFLFCAKLMSTEPDIQSCIDEMKWCTERASYKSCVYHYEYKYEKEESADLSY